MIKKLLLAVLIFMFSVSMAAAGCILTDGSLVYLFTPDGMVAAQVPGDQEVVLLDEQPPADILMNFGLSIREDWSDGVAVYDKGYNVTSLVHANDLEGECEVKKMEQGE